MNFKFSHWFTLIQGYKYTPNAGFLFLFSPPPRCILEWVTVDITSSSLGPYVMKPQPSSGRFWPHGLYLKQVVWNSWCLCFQTLKTQILKVKPSPKDYFEMDNFYLLLKSFVFILESLECQNGWELRAQLAWPLSLEMGKLRTEEGEAQGVREGARTEHRSCGSQSSALSPLSPSL